MSSARCVCDPLTNRGSEYNEFIGYWFSTCVYSNSDLVGWFCGLTNMIIWFNIHLPTIISNMKTGSAASLSPIMLMLWVFADLCGTIGLILTGQGGFLFFTQVYYFLMDLTLMFQYFYYKYFKKVGTSDDVNKNNPSDALVTLDDLHSSQTPSSIPAEVLNNSSFSHHISTGDPTQYASLNITPASTNTSFSNSTSNLSSRTANRSNSSLHGATNYLTIAFCILSLMTTVEASNLFPLFKRAISALPSSTIEAPLETIFTTLSNSIPLCTGTGASSEFIRVFGIILSWICAFIYSFARLGQVYTNYARQHTTGLKVSFIALPLISGFFYIGNILIPSWNYDRTNGFTSADWWTSTFPYVFSAVCNLILNAFIMYQIYTYRENTSKHLAESKGMFPLEELQSLNDKDRQSGEQTNLMGWGDVNSTQTDSQEIETIYNINEDSQTSIN